MNINEHPCEWLDDYLSKDLAPERVCLFDAHLETCDECRLAIDDWSSLRRALKQETELFEIPSPQLLARLEFTLANRAPERRQGQWLRAGGLIAACALLIMLMCLIERPAQNVATLETAKIGTTTLAPVENISFPDDVIGVPIDIGDPGVTVVWLYPTRPAKHATD